MELVTFIQAAKGASKTYEMLKSFVENEMADLLMKIGEVHYHTAIQHLRDAKMSSNPNEQILLAVGSFLTARNFLLEGLPKGFEAWMAEVDILGLGHSAIQRAYTIRKNAYVATILVILCYRYLNQPHLIRQYINTAESDFEKYVSANKTRIRAVGVTFYLENIDTFEKDHELIRESFKEFKEISLQ